MNESTNGEAVCTIFETLNRTGVKLSVFDLLTARFWAQDLNLRQLWDEAKSDSEILEDYEIDPYYVLQIVGLLEPGVDKSGQPRAPSIKRSAVLQMDVGQARQGWGPAVKHGGPETDELLRSHLLPVAPLVADDFDGFLQEREDALMAMISRRTGG